MAQTSKLTKENILEAVKDSWDLYLKKTVTAPIEVSYNHITIDGSGMSSIDICFLGEYPNFVTESTTKNGKTDIIGGNTKYRFTLFKDIDNKYTLSSITPITELLQESCHYPDLTTQNIIMTDYYFANSLVKSLMVTHVDFFPSYVRTHGFKINNFREIKEKEIEGIEIDFSYHPSNNDQLQMNGTVLLLPDYYWLIKRAKINFPDETNVTQKPWIEIENEFDIDSTNFPYLKRRTTVSFESNITQRNETIFKNFSIINGFPTTRFTLSHYGLPEPDFGERRTNRIRYIIMAVGLLLIGIGAWRLIQKRRENT